MSRFGIGDSQRPRIAFIWAVTGTVCLAIIAGFMALALYLPGAMMAGAREMTAASGVSMAHNIATVRNFYSSAVVAKAKPFLTPKVDHATDPHGIPLPATFVLDVSALLSGGGVEVSMTSPYPWPNRAGRTLDDFEKMAWDSFQTNPDVPVIREETVDGKRYVRTAIADRLTAEACVACHNTQSNSPKTGWKLGDVRGILEVSRMIEPSLAAAENKAKVILQIVGLAALASILVIMTIAFFFHRRLIENAEVRKHMELLVHHDPLTGLLKRQSVLDLMQEMAKDKAGGLSALHFIGIDRTGELNGSYGRPSGDLLIRAVADRLKAIAGKDALVGRGDGDEFIIVQPGAAALERAQAFAAGVVEAFATPITAGREQVTVSVSVGVALSHGGEMARDGLLQRADIALRDAKSGGGNCYRLFQPQMLAQLKRRRDLKGMIERAISQDGFELHFQPVHNAQSGNIEGFEALLRLMDGEGGLVPPSQFVHLAEENGLIREIGAWVVRKACFFAANLPDDLFVAVNLSPMQFSTGGRKGQMAISEIVREALDQSGLAPSRFELEITESVFLERSEETVAEIMALHDLGVSLAMDDFGTGYSSLSYLWNLPFDKVKIDRSFVLGWSENTAQVAPIIETIAALCRTLGLRVTVEGIESEKQAEFFRSVGCNQFQGYYFAQPMPEGEVPSSLLANFMRQSEIAGPNIDFEHPGTTLGTA
ncbi:EAL domain-containing protein [Rhizobium sp. PAMB 3182]